jgi:hypothetical protein
LVPPLHPYSSLPRERATKRRTVVTHLGMPIRDVDVPTAWQMRAMLGAIRSALDAGVTVYGPRRNTTSSTTTAKWTSRDEPLGARARRGAHRRAQRPATVEDNGAVLVGAAQEALEALGQEHQAGAVRLVVVGENRGTTRRPASGRSTTTEHTMGLSARTENSASATAGGIRPMR